MEQYLEAALDTVISEVWGDNMYSSNPVGNSGIASADQASEATAERCDECPIGVDPREYAAWLVEQEEQRRANWSGPELGGCDCGCCHDHNADEAY